MFKESREKILILGFGISGKAVASFFCKEDVTVFDQKLDSILPTKILFSNNIVEIINQIKDYSMVVTSPGFSLSHPIILEAKKNMIPVKNDIMIFLERWKGKGIVIGVTGSNGKSTLATLIHKSLKSCGQKSYLYGNIGKSPLELLSFSYGVDPIVVLELSCSQLQLFENKHYVDIGVFTNLSSNHLNLYGGSMEKYARAKLKMVSPESLHVIYYANDEGNEKYIKPNLNEETSQSLNDQSEEFNFCKDLKLKGEHNRYHVSATLMILKKLGLDISCAMNVLKEFTGLEHRIEFVAEIKKVKYINDSKSTSPDAIISAIKSVGIPQRTILITGGSDKDMDYSSIGFFLKKFVREIIILPGTASIKIKSVAKENISILNIHQAVSLANALEISYKVSKKGDCVLFSPGASSGPMHASFEERGNHFKGLVLDRN